MSEYEDLLDFHDKFGMPESPHPRILEPELMNFRIDFLEEELAEIEDAYAHEDLAGIADGLVDLVYVAVGTAELMGLPWRELWDEVQRANMSKERALRVEDSKRGSTFDVIKPAGWTPPDIQGILQRAMLPENAHDRRKAIERRRDKDDQSAARSKD